MLGRDSDRSACLDRLSVSFLGGQLVGGLDVVLDTVAESLDFLHVFVRNRDLVLEEFLLNLLLSLLVVHLSVTFIINKILDD